MTRSTAFLFPGQGKTPDALDVLSERTVHLFDLAAQRGLPLRQWIADGQSHLLSQTENAQPALFIDSLAREEILRLAGWIPAAVAGHSLGEYVALVSSGALNAIAALDVIIERGRVMCGPSGGMAAVLKLDIDAVQSLCAEVGPGVCVANHNSPTQIVVSGESASVEQLIDRAKKLGGRCIPLQVSGPFHSPLMRSAEEALRPWLQKLELATPELSVISSVTGTVECDPESLRAILYRQMTSQVRWVDVMHRLESLGVEIAIEVGSGDVLTRLGQRMQTQIRFMTYKEAIDEHVS